MPFLAIDIQRHSQIESVAIDFANRRARFAMAVPIGVRGSDLVFQRGNLEVRGLHSFATETPCKLYQQELPLGLWVTSDGPFPDPRASTTLAMPAGLPENAFCHYLFISNTNSFIVFAGDTAEFHWNE